ncbi:MAG TPA: trypsin-like peptidase domain-containing protein [Streptosporangiaceae bacterium]
MDHEPDGVGGPGSRRRAVRLSRRAAAAAVLVAVVLVAAIAVLAAHLVAGPGRAAAAAPRPSPKTSAPTVPAVYQRVRPSVVLIRTAGTLGSGFIVAGDGTIMTANHVIAGQKDITVTFFDGSTTTATVASVDLKLDIATLTPAQLPPVVVPATLGGGAGVGSSVVAVGNPLGLTDSVSSGVISGVNRTAVTSSGSFSGLLQFDASVNPGSSGGPLLDASGHVIGIVLSIASPAGEDAFAGIGFAQPISAALGGGRPGRGPQI